MTSNWINAINNYEIDDSLESSRTLATSDSSPLVTTCGQTKVSPDIMGDFSGSSTTEIAVSAWLYQITR
ncbi:unnamed protein product [Blepharisma stoltei]|uniref:Uncharacterized protein n=1 Tax=Blepharisma stoltei TaxID=1481888 RepID=A0AAU9IPL0_9CILI|nr:unnamed protein product [Blepharisma stoltei]